MSSAELTLAVAVARGQEPSEAHFRHVSYGFRPGLDTPARMVDGFLALGASFFLSPQHRLRNRVNFTRARSAAQQAARPAPGLGRAFSPTPRLPAGADSGSSRLPRRGRQQLSKHIEEQLRPFAQEAARLITIPGVKANTAQVLLAEIGADMGQFADAGHWAGISSGNSESPASGAPAKPARAASGCARH